MGCTVDNRRLSAADVTRRQQRWRQEREEPHQVRKDEAHMYVCPWLGWKLDVDEARSLSKQLGIKRLQAI